MASEKSVKRLQRELRDARKQLQAAIERREADKESHKAELGELHHRVRNIFAIVAAIAKQTLARHPSPEEFSDVFSGRIQSLSRSYAKVSAEELGGIRLDEILGSEFSSVLKGAGATNRVSLDGAPVSFKGQSAIALGMIFHEMVTNATKYGALSTPKGEVAVRWKLVANPHGSLTIDWEEKAGKAIKKPKAKGFGMELIERELKGALGSTITFDYGKQGLTARIVIPGSATRFSVAD